MIGLGSDKNREGAKSSLVYERVLVYFSVAQQAKEASRRQMDQEEEEMEVHSAQGTLKKSCT